MAKLIFKYDGQIIEPSPQISVNKEFIYANDVIIGYKYTLNISGYGSSFNNKLGNTDSNMTNTIIALNDIKGILSRNGKVLEVRCAADNSLFLMAYGGILRTWNVEQSNNRYSQYAPFTATMDFNEVQATELTNTEIAGDSVATDPLDQTLGLNELLRHLTSYNDNWNFTIGEEDMYRYYSRVSAEGIVNTEDYTTIKASYTINAVGKHTFDSSGNTVPAWQRAKEFVQKKLYGQIDLFRTNGPLAASNFSNSYYDSRDLPGTNLNDTHTSYYNQIPNVFPILHQTVTLNYTIFNEVITCNTSESGGSFNATYSCIIKFTNVNAPWPQKSIHNFTVNYEQTRDFTNSERTITVQGTLQGLIATNILAPSTVGSQATYNTTGQVFNLPLNGKFINTLHASPVSKYNNALDDFVRYIGNRPAYNYNYFGSDDLSPIFKAVLSINYATLFPNTLPTDVWSCQTGGVLLSSILALPQSFSVDHDYNGSISYSATYATSRSCAMERGFETFTITEKDSVPAYVEFIVPGRSNGPILQNLNTHNIKRITFDFEGVTKKGCLAGTPWSDVNMDDFFGEDGEAEICDVDQYINVPPSVQCILNDTETANSTILIPESHKYDYNPIDGSYKLSKTYYICPEYTECPLS